MPTQSTTYNSRVTDEALEKRFRDTFRSQGGAELVDDLYAQGVIVPVVDFTQAATGDVLDENLQTAWDFSTGNIQVTSTSAQTVISNAGFWRVDLTLPALITTTGATTFSAVIDIFDGSTAKPIWAISNRNTTSAQEHDAALNADFVVFLRSGDSLRARAQLTQQPLDIWYRQIADVSGNLINPTGFTSS